ncbi:hypothetical protein LTR66_007368 [Elasticomyces elasticus]|nr:hypothetical protein LTR28_000567 [Elasticomyces elasticus]KAK4988264.1 hypothetical protein LTR66_007368 [Elasticomyces elasticus]
MSAQSDYTERSRITNCSLQSPNSAKRPQAYKQNVKQDNEASPAVTVKAPGQLMEPATPRHEPKFPATQSPPSCSTGVEGGGFEAEQPQTGMKAHSPRFSTKREPVFKDYSLQTSGKWTGKLNGYVYGLGSGKRPIAGKFVEEMEMEMVVPNLSPVLSMHDASMGE